tara:strand:+ start:70 stop:552 length:483 start_codon:yes stop_codon:yes gene_type:complete
MIKLDYPYASELNPLLYQMSKDDIEFSNAAKLHVDAMDNPEVRTIKVPGDATLTALNIHQKGIKEVDKFFNWLKESIGVEIKRSWVIIYNKGQSANRHRHTEYKTTFSYGINIPEGSSPLMISGDEVKPVVGQVVAFSGELYHSVSASEVDGRCILVGHG